MLGRSDSPSLSSPPNKWRAHSSNSSYLSAPGTTQISSLYCQALNEVSSLPTYIEERNLSGGSRSRFTNQWERFQSETESANRDDVFLPTKHR